MANDKLEHISADFRPNPKLIQILNLLPKEHLTLLSFNVIYDSLFKFLSSLLCVQCQLNAEDFSQELQGFF